MSERVEALGRRFARFATRAVVARPGLWRLFRGPLRAQFDRLAPVWAERRAEDALASLAAALDRLERPPRRALDLGTGTGKAAEFLASRFAQADVTGVDLSPAMVAEARRHLPPELAARVRFEVADASALPYEAGVFDLVVLLNMIPFFGELARVTAPGGTLVVSASFGAETPIYTPWETLRRELGKVGFGSFEEVAVGEGDAFLARRGDPG
ncbi:MAG: class I SAM-dependent methyltransferase [Gaiellaceae bacterium]